MHLILNSNFRVLFFTLPLTGTYRLYTLCNVFLFPIVPFQDSLIWSESLSLENKTDFSILPSRFRCSPKSVTNSVRLQKTDTQWWIRTQRWCFRLPLRLERVSQPNPEMSYNNLDEYMRNLHLFLVSLGDFELFNKRLYDTCSLNVYNVSSFIPKYFYSPFCSGGVSVWFSVLTVCTKLIFLSTGSFVLT